MTSNTPSGTNQTRSILRPPGQKRVRIATADSSSAGDTTTELNFSPTTAPSVAFKTVASKSLQTHLPQLNEFLKPHVESFGTTYANSFFKQLKFDEIMASGTFVPSSAKFKFEPKLLDSIKESDEAATLLSACADYVNEAHQVLGNFARTAFTLNHKEIKARLVKKLGTLLHALATGLIAKHDAKDYNHDVAVLDFLSLQPDEVTAPIKTTPYLFLKSYRELRKLAQLPEPTLPAQDIGHILRAVNNQASRDAIPAAATPGQNASPSPATATTTANEPPPQTTPAKRTSPSAGGTPITVATSIGPAVAPATAVNPATATTTTQTTAITPSPTSVGQITLSQQNVLDFAAQHPQMTLGEVLEQRAKGGVAVNLFVPQKSSTAPLPAGGQPTNLVAPAAKPPTPNVAPADVAGLTQDSDEFYAPDTPDAAAMDVDDASATIPTGRAVVMSEMKRNFERLVVEPLRWFHNQYTYREEHIRIQRATLPQALDSSAEDIAETVNAERALPPRNMRDLVRAEAHKINDGNEREIASLRAQVEKLQFKLGVKPKQKSKKEKKKKKKDSPSADKDFYRSRGKAAATGSANQHRGRAAGPGDATKRGKRGSSRGRSRSKSVGRKGASATKKRN